MRVRHVIDNGTVSREALPEGVDPPEWQALDKRATADVLAALPNTFDTGLAPPGLRLFREAGHWAQVVQEIPPRTARLAWAATEYQARTAPSIYLVAQPWVVVVSLWCHHKLYGARTFYRPKALVSLDDPLYHTNLPNVNATHYGNTAAGWVCFYDDRLDTTKMTWSQRLARMLERASGTEAYSEGNMVGTDGPFIYRRHFPRRRWTFRPDYWEVASTRRGLGIWKDSLVPVRVGGPDDQKGNERGVPLTLGMVLNGKAAWSYAGPILPPPIALSRGESAVDPNTFNEAYARACTRRM